MLMKYHVTCNTDDKYAQHCAAMLCSLFENNRDASFQVHILIHDLSSSNREQLLQLAQRYDNECIFHEVDESKLEGVVFRTEYPLSKAAYYRILLPDVLDSTINKILYLDCDIIILDKITELYNLELDEYALAACVDSCPYNSMHRAQLGLPLDGKAFCSGVMMINLNYWRKVGAVEKLLEYSKRKREHVFLHDQDSLNYVFKNQWFELSPKWNRGVLTTFHYNPYERFFDIKEYILSPKLIHYADVSLKPWYDVWTPDRKYYLKYLQLSQYKNSKFIKRTGVQKFKAYKMVLSYYLSKYIRPFVPHIVEILLRDVWNLISMIYYLVVDRQQLKVKMLYKRWLDIIS